MEKNSTKTKKFFKKFGFYILAGCLAVAIILTLTLSLSKVESNTNVAQEPVVDVDTTPLVFNLPLEGAQVMKGFSSTDLMYNSTLKQWESHKAVDLVSETSNMAVACLEGTVRKVEKTYANGTMIEIEHKNGFVSTYSSLADSLVKQGDNVSAGQNLGEISSTGANEMAQGDHLHFSLSKDAQIVDPSSYLELSNK
ncbi:MAG: peptidoglycan DD-metalloendopeptidase family protein [Christensenellales bacterium]